MTQSNGTMCAIPMQGVRRPQRAHIVPRATVDTTAGVDAKKANLLKAIERSPITVRYRPRTPLLRWCIRYIVMCVACSLERDFFSASC